MSKPLLKIKKNKKKQKSLELSVKTNRISTPDNGFRHKYINIKKKKTIAPMENSMEFPQKIKRTTIKSSNSTSGYTSKGNRITIS